MSDDKAVAVVEPVKDLELQPMSTEEIKRRVERVKSEVLLVDTIKKDLLIEEDEKKGIIGDYGTIPGTKKKMLYKSGAEKICMAFKMTYEYEFTHIDLPNGHFKYVIKTIFRDANTGAFLGHGLGSCSSMETKYRYRLDYETVGDVPQEYWKDRSIAAGMQVKKIDGMWKYVKIKGKVENPDLGDLDNTILKIGKKRSFVDGTITRTGSGNNFEPDLDDHIERKEEKKNDPAPLPAKVEDSIAKRLDAAAKDWVVKTKLGEADFLNTCFDVVELVKPTFAQDFKRLTYKQAIRWPEWDVGMLASLEKKIGEVAAAGNA